MTDQGQKGHRMRIQIDVAMQYRFMRPNTIFLAIEAARYDGQDVLH